MFQVPYQFFMYNLFLYRLTPATESFMAKVHSATSDHVDLVKTAYIGFDQKIYLKTLSLLLFNISTLYKSLINSDQFLLLIKYDNVSKVSHLCRNQMIWLIIYKFQVIYMRLLKLY